MFGLVEMEFRVGVRLHTETQLHSLPGSALKVWVVSGGWVADGWWLKANLVIPFGLALD
jgi:hypothetical protein